MHEHKVDSVVRAQLGLKAVALARLARLTAHQAYEPSREPSLDHSSGLARPKPRLMSVTAGARELSFARCTTMTQRGDDNALT